MDNRKIFALIFVLAVLLIIRVVDFMSSWAPALNVSAVRTSGDIGVYWDENCSLRVYSIDWCVLSPGEVKKVAVYVRNEGSESFHLFLTQLNWNPEDAFRHLIFSWSSEDNRVDVSEVVRVTQNLFASPYITGISDFSFDIVFEAGARGPVAGDINRDGTVNFLDAILLGAAFDCGLRHQRWNPNSDLNGDEYINFLDAIILGGNSDY